jgi:hypothetical protein
MPSRPAVQRRAPLRLDCVDQPLLDIEASSRRSAAGSIAAIMVPTMPGTCRSLAGDPPGTSRRGNLWEWYGGNGRGQCCSRPFPHVSGAEQKQLQQNERWQLRGSRHRRPQGRHRDTVNRGVPPVGSWECWGMSSSGHLIMHFTHVRNLPGILAAGCLQADSVVDRLSAL